MSFIDNMWTNHRTATIVLGVILFPIAIAIIGLKIYMAMNMAAADKSIKEAQKKDDVLSAEEDALKAQAGQALNEADKAAQRIENRHEEDSTDLDWQNKRKD